MQINLTQEEYNGVCAIYTKTGLPVLTNEFVDMCNNEFLNAYHIYVDRESKYWRNLKELTSSSCWNYRV